MKLSVDLLGRTPEESARRLCLGLLDEAAGALERMRDPEDKEALHDFRVSLRRLRSVSRAYRSVLPRKGREKRARRLKALASSTNTARDAEVQLEWLEAARPRVSELGASGVTHLIGVIESQRRVAPFKEDHEREFHSLRRNIVRSFTSLRIRLAPGSNESFASATAELIAEHAEKLHECLARADSAEDGARLHRARLQAKRLRYILEPLQQGFDEARLLVKRMRSLQDLLGELQDTRVLTDLISEALEAQALVEARKLRDQALHENAAPEPYLPKSPGLIELLKLQRERRTQCFANLTADWTGPSGGAFFESVFRFAAVLTVWPAPAFPTRRYLLSEIPKPLQSQKSHTVVDAWLPGKEIVERLRTIRHGRVVRYSRILEREGKPPFEEKLTRSRFEAFWPLTEGFRLESTRYEVPADTGAWVVVSFPAAQIVLAIQDGMASDEIPDVVNEVLVREVTGIKKYLPRSIATSAARSQRASSDDAATTPDSEARSAPETRDDPPVESP